MIMEIYLIALQVAIAAIVVVCALHACGYNRMADWPNDAIDRAESAIIAIIVIGFFVVIYV